jgi:two-component system, response regulator RpfG
LNDENGFVGSMAMGKLGGNSLRQHSSEEEREMPYASGVVAAESKVVDEPERLMASNPLGQSRPVEKLTTVRRGYRPTGIAGHSGDFKSPQMTSRALTIVVIDDQSTGRLLISEILSGVSPNAQVIAFEEPFDAIAYAETHQVDLVLTDYRMPSIDGIETIRRLRAILHMVDVPIVCITIVDDREIKYRALEAGATDFLKRPLDPFECAARCRNLLNLRRHQLLNHEYTENLESRIGEVTREMRLGEIETLLRLARVAEQRDSFTGLHLTRMAKYSALLARECQWTQENIDVLELAAPLHDVGKIAIPDEILQARRRLTEDEMTIMRTHADVGHAMLDGSSSRYLQLAASVARGHHEKFDGSGYPRGLAGEDIPIEARIVAIADVYDALTSRRHYKAAWSVNEAMDHMWAQSDRHFDPALLTKFFACTAEREQIREAYGDPAEGAE